MIMQAQTERIAVYEMTEIRAVTGSEIGVAVTVAPQTTEIPVGTALGKIADSGLYTPYAKAATDGSQTAKVILAEPVPASEETSVATAYVKGIFYKDKLRGIDEDALAALFAREVDNLIII